MDDKERGGWVFRSFEYREVQYREVEIRMEGYPPEAIERMKIEDRGSDQNTQGPSQQAGKQAEARESDQNRPGLGVPQRDNQVPQIDSKPSASQSVERLGEAGLKDRIDRNPTAAYLPQNPTRPIEYVVASPQDHAKRIEMFGATHLDQFRGQAKNEFTAAMQGNSESVQTQEEIQGRSLPAKERVPVHPVLDAKADQMQGDFEKAAKGEEGKEEGKGADGTGSQQVAQDQPRHDMHPPPHIRAAVDRGVHNANKSADHQQAMAPSTAPESYREGVGTTSWEEVQNRVAEKAAEKRDAGGELTPGQERILGEYSSKKENSYEPPESSADRIYQKALERGERNAATQDQSMSQSNGPGMEM